MLVESVKDLIALTLGIGPVVPNERPANLVVGDSQSPVLFPGGVEPPFVDSADLYYSRFWSTRKSIVTVLTAWNEADRTELMVKRIEMIAKYWTTLAADTRGGKVERLLQVRQVATTLGTETSPLAAYVPVDVGFNLRLDEKPGTAGPEEFTSNVGWALVQSRIADPSSVLDLNSHLAPAKCAELLIQLGRVHAILSRFDASRRAAISAGADLAKVMAFYQTEGNFALPPSRKLLDGTDIDMVNGKRIGLPPPHNRFSFVVQSNGTFRFDSVLSVDVDISNVAIVCDKDRAAKKGFPEGQIKELAHFTYHFVIAGLDDMFTYERGFARTTKQWIQRNHPLDKTTGPWDAYSLAFRSLDVASIEDGNPHNAWVIVPTDPPAYVGNILAEGVRHMLLVGTKQVVLAGRQVGPLPDLLEYLVYHAGKNFEGMIMSALIAARASTTSHAAPLKAKIKAATPAAKNTLSTYASTSTVDLVAWQANIVPLLNEPNVLDQLATFIAKAGDAEWNSWDVLRRNCMRYMRMLEYLRALFPPGP